MDMHAEDALPHAEIALPAGGHRIFKATNSVVRKKKYEIQGP